jgi:hypothetical protein
MAGATLRLGKPEMPSQATAPEHGPKFDPAQHFGEVGGMDGVKYVQGKALFNNAKTYVGPAPKEMWLAPLTPRQETDRQKQIQANKKFFHAGTKVVKDAAVPQTIIAAERENAQARAAESRAA